MVGLQVMEILASAEPVEMLWQGDVHLEVLELLLSIYLPSVPILGLLQGRRERATLVHHQMGDYKALDFYFGPRIANPSALPLMQRSRACEPIPEACREAKGHLTNLPQTVPYAS